MLKIGFPETGDALVHARRIKRREIKFDWFSDPLRQAGVVGEIVIGERMHQRGQSR